jgi:type II secretory pathway component PulK
MQGVGWGVAAPERAVLVRLVTVVCGVAVLGATTSIALARHTTRIRASRRLRLRRALPWVAILAIFLASGLFLISR